MCCGSLVLSVNCTFCNLRYVYFIYRKLGCIFYYDIIVVNAICIDIMMVENNVNIIFKRKNSTLNHFLSCLCFLDISFICSNANEVLRLIKHAFCYCG